MTNCRKRVLLVEDETTIQTILKEALELEGYEVRDAANGCEALLTMHGWKPDLILLDLMMPVMSGASFREAQRKLSDGLSEVPVVVISGAHNTRERTASMDVDAVVSKPFDLHDLMLTVGMIISD